MTPRTEIESYLNTLLDVGKFRDYGPNGLQVEGKVTVLASSPGVTASLRPHRGGASARGPMRCWCTTASSGVATMAG